MSAVSAAVNASNGDRDRIWAAMSSFYNGAIWAGFETMTVGQKLVAMDSQVEAWMDGTVAQIERRDSAAALSDPTPIVFT